VPEGSMNLTAFSRCVMEIVLIGALCVSLGTNETKHARLRPAFPTVLDSNMIYHGVFAGNEDRPEMFNAAYLKNYIDAVEPGQKLAWVYFSNEWDVDPSFPRAACDAIHAKGATPFIRIMLRKDP